jgi:hypothetical protein
MACEREATMWWLGMIAGCGAWDGWLGEASAPASDEPAVTIVHSGGMEGELEPCG